MKENETTKVAVVFVGADRLASRIIPLPKGVGPKGFEKLLSRGGWLETEDGETRVKANAVVAYRIEERS